MLHAACVFPTVSRLLNALNSKAGKLKKRQRYELRVRERGTCLIIGT